MQYTTDFCEREYNARAAIPEHPQIFSRWAERGAAARRLRACTIDLAYGRDALEALDLFPAPAGRAPLFVFIHGGYWRSLDKSDFSWLAPPFVGEGVTVALLNYGLAPQAPLETSVLHTLRALAWLYRNGDRLGFDRDRIFVGGHSAGAHLTVMAMAALWKVLAPDLPADLIKGGLAISGIFDLQPLVHAPFVNVDLRLDEARAQKLSPAYLPPATGAPLYAAVGALESNEFQRQTALIGSAWAAVCMRTLTMPDRNHLTVCEELGDPASALFGAALELMR